MSYVTACKIKVLVQQGVFEECASIDSGNTLTKEPGKCKAFQASSCKQESMCHSSSHPPTPFSHLNR